MQSGCSNDFLETTRTDDDLIILQCHTPSSEIRRNVHKVSLKFRKPRLDIPPRREVLYYNGA
jgi:hypothetical protein